MTPSAFAEGPSRSLGRREARASQTTVQLPYRRPSPFPQGEEWRALSGQSTKFRLHFDVNQILVPIAYMYKEFAPITCARDRYTKIANADHHCVCATRGERDESLQPSYGSRGCTRLRRGPSVACGPRRGTRGDRRRSRARASVDRRSRDRTARGLSRSSVTDAADRSAARGPSPSRPLGRRSDRRSSTRPSRSPTGVVTRAGRDRRAMECSPRPRSQSFRTNTSGRKRFYVSSATRIA